MSPAIIPRGCVRVPQATCERDSSTWTMGAGPAFCCLASFVAVQSTAVITAFALTQGWAQDSWGVGGSYKG